MSSCPACGTSVNNVWWFPRKVGELSHEEGQALVDAARAGSRKAHDTLLTSFWPKAHGYFAQRLSGKLAAKIGAEDLAQSACLLAWQHLDDFRGGFEKYHKWLMQICRNLLNAVLRHFAPGSDHDILREERLDAAAIEAMQPHAHRRQHAPDETAAGLELTASGATANRARPFSCRQWFRPESNRDWPSRGNPEHSGRRGRRDPQDHLRFQSCRKIDSLAGFAAGQ